MKRANGMGTIIKLTGNRRKPWAIRRVIGWKEDGHPIIKYQGYYHTRREAERALNEYNNDPYTISNKTLADIYEEWYEMREDSKRAGTLKAYRVLFTHVKPLADMRIRDIDRNVLQAYYEQLDVSANTLNRVMQFLNMLFDHAVKRNILPPSALTLNKSLITPSKEVIRRGKRKAITRADIDKLWELKDNNEYAKIILVYIYTGLRFSELKDLTPECCHDNYVEVKQAKTAAGVRIVPLSDKVQSLLPIIKVPSRTTFDRYFKFLLPNNCIHETRHTFISLMTEAGVDPRILKAIVGHSVVDVTDHYTHISLDVMLEAVNRL